MRSFSSDAFREGRIPLWNPTIYCGTPFLATFQPAVFYPPNLLLSFSGRSVADQMTYYLVFHFLVAAIGMYAYNASPGTHSHATLNRAAQLEAERRLATAFRYGPCAPGPTGSVSKMGETRTSKMPGVSAKAATASVSRR